MGTNLQEFWRDESGPEMVEWAVVTVILLVATTFVIILLRNELIALFQAIFVKLSEQPPDSWLSP